MTKRALSICFGLGLFAVSVQAQTVIYNATAGSVATGGSSTLNSAYSMSTGAGAMVGATIPLSFILPKKIAIAVSPEGTNTLPVLSEFTGAMPYATTQMLKVLDTRTNASVFGTTFTNLSANFLCATGAIYSNTPISITFAPNDFIHEVDATSVIKDSTFFRLGKKDATSGTDRLTYLNVNDDNDSATSIFPYTKNITETDLATEGGKITFYIGQYAYLDTIEPSDRAGKYTSSNTMTITSL